MQALTQGDAAGTGPGDCPYSFSGSFDPHSELSIANKRTLVPSTPADPATTVEANERADSDRVPLRHPPPPARLAAQRHGGRLVWRGRATRRPRQNPPHGGPLPGRTQTSPRPEQPPPPPSRTAPPSPPPNP